MATEKVFLPVFIVLFLGFTVKGDYEQGKYTQTSNNFLDTNIVKLTAITDAIDYAILLCNGVVTKAEQKFKKDIPVWKVDVRTKDNASLKVEMSAFDNSLIRIDADTGPFDYEISPGKNLIPFSLAKKTAEENSAQKVLKWCLLKNKSQWEYNFWLFISSGKAQLRVNAESGEVITSKKISSSKK